jgi:hypothetical protein
VNCLRLPSTLKVLAKLRPRARPGSGAQKPSTVWGLRARIDSRNLVIGSEVKAREKKQ